MRLSVKKVFMLLFIFLYGFQAQAKEEERFFTIINAASGLADNSAQIVKCTKTGRIIISTIGNLNFFDGKSFTHADIHPRYEYELPYYHGHYHLYFDLHHHIWLKDKLKVSCLDLMMEQYVQNVDSVIKSMGCNEKVLDLFADQYNDIWFLTQSGLFNPDYNRTYKVNKDLNLQDVDRLDDILYLFYENGSVTGLDTLGNVVCQLTAYDEERQAKYSNSSVLQPTADGFFQIRNGSGGGILQYFDARQQTWEIITERDFHLNNMTFDSKGTHLYIPCEYGYMIYDMATKEMEHLPELHLTNGRLLPTDCNVMAFDHQGGLWIGTEKHGVLYARPHSVDFRSYSWDNEVASHYASMLSHLQKNITNYEGKRAYCKYIDSRGWTWVGTQKGLYLEQPGVADPTIFTRRSGLHNDVVHSVVEDNDHNIWVGTSCGITFFLIRGGEVVFVNNFTGEDNVPNESFENCKAMLLPDSSIVMQSVDHIVVFKPSDLEEVNFPHLITNIKPKLIKMLMNGNDVIPGVAYDDNVISDRAWTRTKHINLKSDQNSISLTFSALNYFRPSQTYYRVRVYELGNEWQVFSSQNSSMVDSRGLLHYPLTQLAPGSYHLEVQSSMFPDMWEENIPDEKRFVWEIHVKQPWWRTSGLIVLLATVLLVLMIVNFFLYNRITRMRDRRNNEEGDIIRKIRFFVERCNAVGKEPLSPNSGSLGSGITGPTEAGFSPEFIALMKKLIPYVSINQNRALTMRKLSEVGGVDIVQLYKVISGHLGKSPADLVRIIHVHKGADLLANSSMSVDEVASACGFYTPNYFIGSFFHEYKQTPQEYRKSLKSK